jgi:septal ring factor EnvC (AmiA/AmiB activator)
MSSFLNDTSNETIQEIERMNQEIAELQEKMEAAEKEAKELMEREVSGEGIFASRVFELKQGKMALVTEIQHKKVRINHLLLNPGSRES